MRVRWQCAQDERSKTSSAGVKSGNFRSCPLRKHSLQSYRPWNFRHLFDFYWLQHDAIVVGSTSGLVAELDDGHPRACWSALCGALTVLEGPQCASEGKGLHVTNAFRRNPIRWGSRYSFFSFRALTRRTSVIFISYSRVL